jgi:long-chain fatty acid transport protein
MTPRNHLIGLLALLIAFSLTVSAFAGGYNLAGVGAKALAMSGAFRAVADDYSAIYWNPAGLAGQGKVFTLDGKILYPMVWLTPNVSSSYPGYEGYRNGVEQTCQANGYPAPTLGLTCPISDRFTAGFSAFAPSALGADWRNLFTGPPYGYNNTVPYPEKAWFSDLKVFDFHPTVAYQATDKLKVGLGFAAEYGDVTLESPKLVPTGAPMPFQDFYIDATLEGTGWGYGYNLGVLYALNDKVRLGLAYRSAVTIAVEGSVKQKLIFPYSRGMQQADPTKAALFNGGMSEASPDAAADFPIPADLGLGVACNCLDNVTLALDVVWTNWGDVKDVNLDLNGTGPTGAPAEDTKLVLRYEDTYRVSLGADYLLASPNNLHLRAGYYYDPSPIPDGSLRPTITDVADKHNISFGFGYPINDRLSVDGYYERVMTGDREITAEDMNSDGVVDNLPGKWKLQVDTFGLAFGYRF